MKCSRFTETTKWNLFSVEFGVWSFGRGETFYLENTFVPDCITMDIVLENTATDAFKD